MNDYWVYILSNWDHSVVYVGMTNNLERRVFEHKNKTADGFTKKYSIDRLVYFEATSDVNAAIAREKQIKGYRREKKNALVFSLNPEWRDLALDWNEQDPSSQQHAKHAATRSG